jgi:putative addiction module component (TIGR02574 family)
MNILMNEILKLNVSERMRIANQIWKSIPKEKVSPPISEEVQVLLTNRLKKFKENPNSGISLEESKNRIKSKIEIHRKNRARRSK